MKIIATHRTPRLGRYQRPLPVERLYRPRGSRGALMALDRRRVTFEDGRAYSAYGVSAAQSGLGVGYYRNRRDAVRFMLKAGRILRHPAFSARDEAAWMQDRALVASVREPLNAARWDCSELTASGVLRSLLTSRCTRARRRVETRRGEHHA